ncbi:hypothetical protein CASFOL_012478 [Castilleja foliolosa]|uniref:BHLH domain-containing protein n=1 Tax=Castilleja foliolosa TaxID=1961234 RepID=A0ABD3DHE2_9LAMI
MENEKMFANEVNCSNYWDNSMDIHQPDPFESALSSMVSSPTASNNGNDNNIVVRELIGRLGTICSSDYNYNNNNSTNTSCYITPLSSPPKLNLSIMENRDFPILPPFSADPGFAHRAAAFSPFAVDKSKLNSSDSRDNSSLSEQQIPIGGLIDPNSRKRKSIPKGNKGKQSSVPKPPNNIASENSDSSAKRSKSEDDEKDAANDKQSKALEAPKDYIHVRARRGQATDAHSLAERVRREKISERMKMLQDLVPGCNKVTGKAVMLDEIINYVQSLQRQVEFLSMKLSTVNPGMDEALMSNSKDMFESHGSMPHNMYPPESYHFPSQPNTNTANNFSAAFGRNQSLRIDNFSETASQVSTFWEDDLHSVVQMRYNQNDTQDFHGVQMKVEL